MNLMTRHAQRRCQQRGLSPIVIDLLLKFGSSEPAGAGTTRVFIDKAARRRVQAYAGPLTSKLSEHLDVYAVLGADGRVITAAHRTERI